MLCLSTLKGLGTQFATVLWNTSGPPCPLTDLSSPVPSPGWFSMRGSWQRSKLVNTLPSRSVDSALWLLILCPAHSRRRKFLCVQRRADPEQWPCQPDPWAGAGPLHPRSALSTRPWASAACLPVQESDTHVLLWQWPVCPGKAALTTREYHRNLTATATSYLSTPVQRDITSLDS